MQWCGNYYAFLDCPGYGCIRSAFMLELRKTLGDRNLSENEPDLHVIAPHREATSQQLFWS